MTPAQHAKFITNLSNKFKFTPARTKMIRKVIADELAPITQRIAFEIDNQLSAYNAKRRKPVTVHATTALYAQRDVIFIGISYNALSVKTWQYHVKHRLGEALQPMVPTREQKYSASYLAKHKARLVYKTRSTGILNRSDIWSMREWGTRPANASGVYIGYGAQKPYSREGKLMAIRNSYLPQNRPQVYNEALKRARQQIVNNLLGNKI